MVGQTQWVHVTETTVSASVALRAMLLFLAHYVPVLVAASLPEAVLTKAFNARGVHTGEEIGHAIVERGLVEAERWN